jgi:hypothetical protein
MTQTGCGFRLSPETAHGSSAGKLAGEDHLHRDRSLEADLLRPVNHPHSATADRNASSAAGVSASPKANTVFQ